jgi:hypothetical protein
VLSGSLAAIGGGPADEPLDGLMAYVSCDASHQMAEIDLKEWKVGRLIEAGPAADGLAWAATKP